MKPRPPSAEEVNVSPPPLSDIEVARMWRALSNTPMPLPRKRATRPPLLLAFGLAIVVAAAAFGLIVWLSPRDTSSETGLLEAASNRSPEFGLPDGSHLALGPGAQLDAIRMDQRTIELALGAGTMDVTANDVPERQRFAVIAGGYEIIATTRGQFRVSLTGDGAERRLEVTVRNGSVDVHDPAAGSTTPLVAGTWSALLPEP